MNDRLDELNLQRLVDGTLDPTRRHVFLATIEQHPEWWREVALAFVEDQLLSEVLDPSRQELDTATCGQTVGPETSCTETSVQPAPKLNPRSARQLQQLALMAASALLILAVGWRAGQWRAELDLTATQPGQERLQLAQDQPAAPDREKPVELTPLETDTVDDLGHLRFAYGEGASRELVEVPIVDPSQVPGSVLHEPTIADFDRINRELESFGYRINWQTEFLGGELAGGRQLVVPVQSVSLQYRGQ